MVGFVCLGGIVRLGYDPAVVGNSKDLETTRLGLDVLMAAQFPIAIKSVSLIPGLGLGAGWLRLSGSKWIGEEAHSEDESSRPMKEESHVVDLGGLRADAFVNLSIDLTRSLSLVIGFTASIWRAVAYTRSGMNSEATKALNYHIKKYPNSPRAGEASTMLGWRLLKAGDIVRAQELFESARDDKVARVRQSANRGLKDVQKKRATE